MKKRHLTALAVVGIFSLSASSCDERGLGDAPIGNQIEVERTVIVNVDGFPNLSVICDGTTAIMTNTRSAGNMLAIPDSEYCPPAPKR